MNLVIAVCGDESLHRHWLSKANPEFDLFVVYYGNNKNRYANDGLFYQQQKGSKFNIISQLEIPEQYDAILIPDDDLYWNANDINLFFRRFHEYDLWLAQPSIIGYQSLLITANVPQSLLRYTSWVEIMTPCFSKYAYDKCRISFSENRTNWGIDCLWTKLLGFPQDKIAIVDELAAIHTRPCFFGDTYQNNNNSFPIAIQELYSLLEKYDIKEERVVYNTIPKLDSYFRDLPSEHKLLPNVATFGAFVEQLRRKQIFI
jgi:hypothetical protein